MSYPVLERISQAIVTRIGGVTKTAGYSLDIGRVSRPKQNWSLENFGHLDAVIVQDDKTRIKESDYDGNPPAIAWDQPFDILLIVRQSESDETPIDQLVNQFEADVQKCITTPNATWHHWDSLAFNSMMGDQSTRFSNDDGTVEGVALRLNVHFRHSEYDPYTVR